MVGVAVVVMVAIVGGFKPPRPWKRLLVVVVVAAAAPGVEKEKLRPVDVVAGALKFNVGAAVDGAAKFKPGELLKNQTHNKNSEKFDKMIFS